MMGLKWLRAKLNLAWGLILHLLYKRWFQSRGLETFLKEFEAEGLFPLSLAVRERSARFGNCIQCGLCVTACKIKDPVFFERFHSPAQLAFSYTRSLPELSLNEDYLSYCRDCRNCEKVCPTGVPLQEITELVLQSAKPV